MQLDFSVSYLDSTRLEILSVEQVYNTLLVDKNYKTPVVAQASSNLVRCTLAAVTISFLQHLINALGVGWTFTCMGGLCLVATFLFFVDYHKGTAWRQNHGAS